ncbi:peptidyl-prolyl cis-trans isomerase-like 3 [Brachionus plicatilis]|uniref:peptidylprolyl isomerase n=1 Tax=Brachionus plicatilis TaxID=10195 RepID=A0A3M7RFX5_BRAPC|nr:peptidyl-prolyl cis-trans isomerase-like 3 [Brachionus plicatilis]
MDFSGDWSSLDTYYYDPYDSEIDDFIHSDDYDILKTYEIESEWIFNIKNMFFHCMMPSVIQTLSRFSPIILNCILFQLLCLKTNISTKNLIHVNLATSLGLLINYFGTWVTFYLTIIALVSFLLLNLNKFKKILIPLACLVHLFYGQLRLERDVWMSFRGAEMILIMKIISTSFDFESTNIPDLFSYLSYLFSINTSVIGPWISYENFSNQITMKSGASLSKLKNTISYLGYAMITLVCSNCLLSSIEGYVQNVPFLEMYFQALSFRQSNYFICYLSQFIFNLSQMDDSLVIRQIPIELPRSMVNVVTNWNLPMHFWLKKYVFQNLKKKFGIFISLFVTYFVSSAIHGFDPNIILVLFSIGWFAYVEFEFRAKISDKLSSCIGSRECKDKCSHFNKKTRFPVKTMNSYFYLLNIYHLAYLGQIFYFENGQDTDFWHVSVSLHTDIGDIKLELYCEAAPKACKNFLALCASGYYDGCVFHRNIKGFIVQTGDPSNTGKGGKSIWGDFFEDEFDEHLKHSKRGVVSMANKGSNTNGSQFFISYSKQSNLDMKYTIFAHVIDGFETLDELEKIPVNEKNYRPNYDIKIKNVTIHANPIAELES